uniref:hypothetical protein n=1 Tax=uncultured Caulobacter sp. TaxID=158749 RepID=UPI0025D9F605|nr:hypothetical protein [uncultured Caulobacter sp.]
MRVRDPSDQPPFSISHSELFEEAVFALQRQFPLIDEGVQNLEWMLSRMPYANERCAVFEGRDFFIAVSPRTPRAPSFRVLYEVAGRRVHLWSLSVREP